MFCVFVEEEFSLNTAQASCNYCIGGCTDRAKISKFKNSSIILGHLTPSVIQETQGDGVSDRGMGPGTISRWLAQFSPASLLLIVLG